MTAETNIAPAPAPAPAPASDSSKLKAQSKNRKRASKACLSCRARKVRCDVSQRGRPCMNCYLDNDTCVVTSRASRLKPQREEDIQASHPPYNKEPAPPLKSSLETPSDSRTNSNPGNSRESSAKPTRDSTHNHGLGDDQPRGSPGDERSSTSGIGHNSCHHRSKPSSTERTKTGTTPFAVFGTASAFDGDTTTSQWNSLHGVGVSADVTYSYYPWITVSNISDMPPQDVNYLELQGCLRVPTRNILAEFMQQYFLHFHPMSPMMNEGDFWEIFDGSDVAGKVSLLVLQSMLFVSCNFVSRQSIQSLGFPDIRTARSALYRRCKLLYDLDTEMSPTAISQAALLLTTWFPPSASGGTRKSNTSWLAIAIQNAKTAEAHHYGSLPVSGSSASSQAKKQNLLKRIWWCCVLRDRIMGLCIRRSIHITRNHFDFEGNSILGFADLADEIGRSRVYSPDTKKCLAGILEQVVKLCVLLTDILVLVFPLDDSPGWGRPMGPEQKDKARQYRVALRSWYELAELRFPLFGGGSLARRGPGSSGTSEEVQHDSVILYTNLMYMYYHSARVALSHHEILHLAITASAPSFNTIPTSDLAVISENRHELQDAASGVTECLKGHIHLRLARWLPISAVALAALPLFLHILDVKLSSSSSSLGDGQTKERKESMFNEDIQRKANSTSLIKQHRLNILIQAMKTLHPLYDGVDRVADTIRHMIGLAQLDPPGPPRNGGDSTTAGSADMEEGASSYENDGPSASAESSADCPVSGWTDILAAHPSSYLRLALTMDLSLSKGRLPEDSDFPVGLRGLFTGGFNPLRYLLEKKRKEARMRPPAAAATESEPSGSQGRGTTVFDPSRLFPASTAFAPPSFSHYYYDALAAVNHGEPSNLVSSSSAAGSSGASTGFVNLEEYGSAFRPFVLNTEPGVVTALSPDSEGSRNDSIGSAADMADTQPPHIGGLGGLGADEAGGMTAFHLDGPESTTSTDSVGMDGMQLDEEEESGNGRSGDGCDGGSSEWMTVDALWENDDCIDRDSARALLEALEGGLNDNAMAC